MSLLLLLGCVDEPTVPLAVAAPDSWVGTLAAHMASLPHGVDVLEGDVVPDVGAELAAVVVEDDTRCGECFRVEAEGAGFVIRAGGLPGAMYGLAALMEGHGWRFAHPFQTDVPSIPELAVDVQLDTDFAPEMERRGYHPHTLHPTEAMYDVWGDPDTKRATAMLDWVVRNRGNYVQWPGLDNIVGDPNARATWAATTTEILDAAHARGMTVGVGVQLFGLSNLQQAYDLLDRSGTEAEDEAAMLARWATLTDGVQWDEVSLSFGEFFSADPALFIGRIEMAYDTLQATAPGTTLNAVLHVGGNEDVQVEYDGKEMTYYFLATYADRPIEPFVHSVMYYNLVEDAGGAYGLDSFAEHRTYLEAALAAGETVTYFPESAYWVAFDVSVPTSLPLYVRSRWLDLDTLRTKGTPLQRHVLFASGWEWGYWLNDAATLRMGYTLPDHWEDSITAMYADPATGAAAVAAAEAERPLIDDRLAPYLAGRDIAMDLGDATGIFSQPRRVLFDEIAALSSEERAALRVQVVDGLERFAAAHEAAAAGLGEDVWAAELTDGLAANGARARFMAALYDAVFTASEGGDPTPALAEADSWFSAGAAVIARRHGALHDPEAERLTIRNGNPTLYDYGYLTNADTQCFWQRERNDVRKLLLGESGSDPGCTL